MYYFREDYILCYLSVKMNSCVISLRDFRIFKNLIVTKIMEPNKNNYIYWSPLDENKILQLDDRLWNLYNIDEIINTYKNRFKILTEQLDIIYEQLITFK